MGFMPLRELAAGTCGLLLLLLLAGASAVAPAGALAVTDATASHRASFDSAGVKISYVEAGAGEPVVLVHGLYSSAEMNWIVPGTFAALTQHYHVVALDLRGHGQSDRPKDDSAYGHPMVEDVVRLLDHLKIERAHVVGYSLGGIIVMRLVIDHPDRVLSATLGGMGWFREGSFEQAIFQEMGGREFLRTPAACTRGIAKLAVTEAELRRVEVPIEILVGDRDPCRMMYVKPLQRVRPDWPVVTVSGAGHLNCITKSQFKDEVVRWIGVNANQAAQSARRTLGVAP